MRFCNASNCDSPCNPAQTNSTIVYCRVYHADVQIAVKVLLTPPALVADGTLVGGLFGLYCLANSNSENDKDYPDPKDYSRHRRKHRDPGNP